MRTMGGQQRPALKVDDTGVRAGKSAHIGETADAADPAAFFHQGFMHSRGDHGDDRAPAIQRFSQFVHTFLSLAGNSSRDASGGSILFP